MIKLNLLRFGGRGGSSGVGGKHGDGSASGGGTSQSQGGKKESSATSSIAVGRILKEDDISSKENYVLYRIVDSSSGQREIFYKDKTGSELRDDIAYEKLELNRKEKVWVSKKGNKYAIRKR